MLRGQLPQVTITAAGTQSHELLLVVVVFVVTSSGGLSSRHRQQVDCWKSLVRRMHLHKRCRQVKPGHFDQVGIVDG
jgi:hypothetical protein